MPKEYSTAIIVPSGKRCWTAQDLGQIWVVHIVHVDVSMGILPEWMVYVMENPNLKWMIQRGTTISGNPHVKT